MNFSIRGVCGTSGRLASLSDLGCHGNVVMETPGCMLYTRCGSVPNLSHPLLNGMVCLPPVSQIPLPTVVESQEALQTFDRGIAAFSGRPDAVVFTCTQDPGRSAPTGYNDKNSVSIWASGGRKKLTCEGFLLLQESLSPDWMEALSDGDTPSGASSKRIKKAVDRTLRFVDQCLQARLNRQKLKNVEVFGVLVGGDCLKERLRSAQETAKRPVGGFVLDGLHEGSMEEASRWSIMQAVLKELPEDKPRFLPRVGRPDEVIKAVQLGVDIFDSIFPYEVTERGCALIFSFTTPSSSPQNDDEDIQHSFSSRSTEDALQPCREVEGIVDGTNDDEAQNVKTIYEIDLSEKRYVDDFSSIVEGCKCYCCVHHTKAYINHLLNAKELLAGVLLMIHNCHHYFGFFQSVRRALQDERLEQLTVEITKPR